jgi:predicted Zn-dependent protease
MGIRTICQFFLPSPFLENNQPNATAQANKATPPLVSSLSSLPSDEPKNSSCFTTVRYYFSKWMSKIFSFFHSLIYRTINSEIKPRQPQTNFSSCLGIDRRVEVPNSWAASRKNEVEQTLEAFKAKPSTIANAHRNVLNMTILENISAEEHQILDIVKDYLYALHGIQTTVDHKPVPLNSSFVRNGQYAVEPQLENLRNCLSENSFTLGFTSRDLYPHAAAFNFVLGVGMPELACGLFSTHRICTADFAQNLKRLMKLATHEFAHMRGVNHCTEYVCTMQGVNSVREMDEVPLILCSQDMAKICYLNQWNLKEGYERQLRFFNNFSQQYGISVNFSQEIADLENKIRQLAR